MGQYYLFANVLKSQGMGSMMRKALEILANGSYLPWLQLFLLDLEDKGIKQFSLQNLCLKFLNENKFPPGALEELPASLQKKLDLVFLSQCLVGEWAGDRLIITGDYSDYSPFPPDGKWKKGDLYSLVEEQFSGSHAEAIYEHYEKPVLEKLKKFCEGKHHIVVNLDKREFLDPLAYKAKEKTVYDMINSDAGTGVMAGLIILLTHSTGAGGGDFNCGEGHWAGDRITICTANQLEDFVSYRDVSNPKLPLSILRL